MTLPRETGCEGDFFYETLALGREESSFDHTRDSHSRRCDGITCTRAAGANAEACWAAIAILVVMQSTLGATLALSACIDSLKSQSESSLLWLSWRCGQNINGLHPIALLNSRETFVSYPSKEVLSALSCEASKNPPTASW